VGEGSPTHGSRRGLSSTAPIGAVELFSEYGIYATNLRYMTLGGWKDLTRIRHPQLLALWATILRA
jgi:hypothetical protein